MNQIGVTGMVMVRSDWIGLVGFHFINLDTTDQQELQLRAGLAAIDWAMQELLKQRQQTEQQLAELMKGKKA